MARNFFIRIVLAVGAMSLWTTVTPIPPTTSPDLLTAYVDLTEPEVVANRGSQHSHVTGQPHRGRGAGGIVTINGATRLEGEMIRWALGRFHLAELELPQFDVSFHDDLAECQGFIGLYSASRRRVEICNRGGRPTDPRHTVLHEFAHAWSLARLTETKITEFVGHRGLESWHSEELAWWRRGDEQAAEIIAWGLQDTNEYKSIWIHTETCDGLAATFAPIADIPPVHTNTQNCK